MYNSKTINIQKKLGVDPLKTSLYKENDLKALKYNDLINIVKKLINTDIRLAQQYGGQINNYSQQELIKLIQEIIIMIQRGQKKGDQMDEKAKQDKIDQSQKKWQFTLKSYYEQKQEDLFKLKSLIQLQNGEKIEQKINQILRSYGLLDRIIFNANKMQFEDIMIPNSTYTAGKKLTKYGLNQLLQKRYDFDKSSLQFLSLTKQPEYQLLISIMRKLAIKKNEQKLSKKISKFGSEKPQSIKELARSIKGKLVKYYQSDLYKEKVDQLNTDVTDLNKLNQIKLNSDIKIIDENAIDLKKVHDEKIIKNLTSNKKLVYNAPQLQESVDDLNKKKLIENTIDALTKTMNTYKSGFK